MKIHPHACLQSCLTSVYDDCSGHGTCTVDPAAFGFVTVHCDCVKGWKEDVTVDGTNCAKSTEESGMKPLYWALIGVGAGVVVVAVIVIVVWRLKSKRRQYDRV